MSDGPWPTNRSIGVAQGKPMFCRTRLLGLSPQRSIWRKPAALQLPILLWLSNGGLRQCSRTSCRSQHRSAYDPVNCILFQLKTRAETERRLSTERTLAESATFLPHLYLTPQRSRISLPPHYSATFQLYISSTTLMPTRRYRSL